MELFLSFCGEGSSDERFFKNISERMINNFLLGKNISAEISWMKISKRPKKGNSEESLLHSAKESREQGLLIYHRDADCDNREQCLKNHFNTGMKIIGEDSSGRFCRHIVLAIPIQETEAWMLCDRELLKQLIETDLNNATLELTYQINGIENIADPKAKIEKAIIIHKSNLPARRRRYAVNLVDLYEPFSQDVSLEALQKIESFRVFKEDLLNVIGNLII